MDDFNKVHDEYWHSYQHAVELEQTAKWIQAQCRSRKLLYYDGEFITPPGSPKDTMSAHHRRVKRIRSWQRFWKKLWYTLGGRIRYNGKWSQIAK